MKPFYFALVFLTSCFSSHPTSQGHHYQLYLTNDLGINSCLYAYENYLNHLLQLGWQGKLDGQLASNQKATQEAVKAAFHFQVSETNAQKQSLVPVDQLFLRYSEQTMLLYTFNPFNQDTTLLFSFKQNQNRKHSHEETLVFSVLNSLNSKETGIISASQWYRFSQLKLEQIQKEIAQKALEQVIQAFDDQGKPLSQQDLIKAKQETISIQDEAGGWKTIWQDIPDQDLWKGFFIKGQMQQMQLSSDTIGLLYHPRSKFGGYNPGNIPWFIFSLNDRGLNQNERDALQALIHFSQLYTLDPEQYTSAYFRNIKLPIRNLRYP